MLVVVADDHKMPATPADTDATKKPTVVPDAVNVNTASALESITLPDAAPGVHSLRLPL